MFFEKLLLKIIKNMNKRTLNCSIHSSKKHRQYESNKVTTKHSLCPRNGVFAHEKCIIFVILYVFALTTTKNTTLKKQRKTFKKLFKKNIKNMYFKL